MTEPAGLNLPKSHAIYFVGRKNWKVRKKTSPEKLECSDDKLFKGLFLRIKVCFFHFLCWSGIGDQIMTSPAAVWLTDLLPTNPPSCPLASAPTALSSSRKTPIAWNTPHGKNKRKGVHTQFRMQNSPEDHHHNDIPETWGKFDLVLHLDFFSPFRKPLKKQNVNTKTKYP